MTKETTAAEPEKPEIESMADAIMACVREAKRDGFEGGMDGLRDHIVLILRGNEILRGRAR